MKKDLELKPEDIHDKDLLISLGKFRTLYDDNTLLNDRILSF